MNRSPKKLDEKKKPNMILFALAAESSPLNVPEGLVWHLGFAQVTSGELGKLSAQHARPDFSLVNTNSTLHNLKISTHKLSHKMTW